MSNLIDREEVLNIFNYHFPLPGLNLQKVKDEILSLPLQQEESTKEQIISLFS